MIEYKDRLTRFGFNYLEILAKKQNFEIVVVNKSEDDKEGLISIITSFCDKIYGSKRKAKTERIIKELNEEETSSMEEF